MWRLSAMLGMAIVGMAIQGTTMLRTALTLGTRMPRTTVITMGTVT